MNCAHPNCKARVMKGAEFCYFHNPAPDVAAKRALARSAGGKVPHRRPKGEALERAIALATDAMEQLSNGSMKIAKARQIARLAEIIIYGKESTDLTRRMHAIKSGE